MKKQRQKAGAKVETPQKTGAPLPAFLEYAIEPLAGIKGTRLLIAKSRKEREPLKALSTEDISKQVWLRLLELAERIQHPRIMPHGELENSALDLARAATTAAHFLKDFAESDKADEAQSVMLAARRKSRWPDLLSLGAKKDKNGNLEPTLEGAEKVKSYLIDIHLGQNAPGGLKQIGDPDATPFKNAAAWLLQGLNDLREHGAWRGEITLWAERLFCLDVPMTTANVNEWWAVAKQWMDEAWKTNPTLFKPLIESCRSRGKSLTSGRHELYPSEVRCTVIDIRLRETFFALAKPTDLWGFAVKFQQRLL